MLLYSLPAFTKGDSTPFLSGVARSNKLVKKHGELDLIGASRILLRDWSTGKFARYTSPPKSSTTTAAQSKDMALKKLYEADEAILDSVMPRKELRKSTGLVKLTSGEIDSRMVILEEPWLKEDEVGSVEDEDREDGEMEVDESVSDEEENDDDIDDDADEEEGEEGEEKEEKEEEKEEDMPPPSSKKHKRKRTNEPSTAPPTKKVAFAPDPRSSKRAGIARSLKGMKPEKPTTTKAKPLDFTNSATRPKSKPVGVKPERRAANIGVKGKATTTDAGGDEAYDFGKFF